MDKLKFKKSDGIAAIAWLSSLIQSLKDDVQYTVEVKQYRERRSLDANAYCWVLIDKLAEKTGYKKVDIYRAAIHDVGGVSETVCVTEKAADKLCETWEVHGLGWQTERLESKINGCVNVVLYYGSSVYDTAQMSRLIDIIIEDCRALGIETMTPAEIEMLKAEWGRQK